jgi:hypothetical protein
MSAFPTLPWPWALHSIFYFVDGGGRFLVEVARLFVQHMPSITRFTVDKNTKTGIAHSAAIVD